MKKCNYCGAELNECVRFCGQCGNPVSENPNSSEQESYTTVQTESTLTDKEQPVQNQEYETNAAVELENNSGANERNGIGKLAIVMCSIALSLVIALIVLKIVQNSKPKYRIVNQVQTVQSTPPTKNKTKSIAEEAINLVKKWDAIHNSKKTGGFASIYASQVKYYQQTCTPQQIIKSKQDLFDKTPEFQQSVSNFNVSGNIDGSIKVHFDKLVQTSAKKEKKTYPSYLVVKNINGNWLIIEESDDVTDANLAKKVNNNSPQSDGQVSKFDESCFVSGLKRHKLYGYKGGNYVYKDNIQLNVSLSLNQPYMECKIADESGTRDCLDFDFCEGEEQIDFYSEKTKYVVGQYDFDNNGIDELVIGMYSPKENDEYENNVAAVVYSVNDRRRWNTGCLSVMCGVYILIENNEISVPWNCRGMDYEFVFKDGNFYKYSDFDRN